LQWHGLFKKLGHSLTLGDQGLNTTRGIRQKGTSRTNQHAIVYRAHRRIADLCCHGVPMVQPAEARKGPSLASNFGSKRDRPTCWRVLREPKMRPIVMIVAHVFGHQSLQMPFVQYDHVIQQISPATSYPAFSGSVLPGTTKRRSHWPHPRISHERYHVIAKFGVAVEQQKTVGRGVWPRFPHLLHDPKCAGVSGDVATENLAPLVPDDEKTVQHTKGKRRYCKEVHGSDGVAVISQECQPTLGGVWSSRDLSQPSRDRRFREDKAQLEQLAVNAWRSPGWILSRHAED
jgi:hypothetical protein